MKNNKFHNTPPLIEFKNLTVLKGKNKKVLDAVSLKIWEGENIAIIGPNGAGKSSLIKTITRQYYPLAEKSGYLFKIWGQEVWNIFDLRSLLGIVSNDLQYTCNREITGMEIILSGFFGGIGLYRESISARMKKKAREITDFLEICHLRDRRMDEMSSGEARRFLIGRALVHDPKALILDEPTNSLDLHALYKFTGIMRKIARAGTSVVLVTQSISDIIPEIKRVILMKEGRIYRDGPKETILTKKNISGLFARAVEIQRKGGYYYPLRGR
ncbi:MAG: ATP-binding cassette domain-containing protein [Candidatus Omnitrophota bacterium]